MSVPRRSLPFVAVLLSPVLLTGCRVETHKSGDNNNVDIGTPFGSMHVKTDQAGAVETGLTLYPGAVPVRKHGEDSSAADVNMSFGSFRLGVHAVELQSGDPEDKVLAFYRKDMAKFGPVITCHGSQTVGQPTRTPDGLSCDEHVKAQGHDAGSDDLELRAGSQRRQHIVGVHTADGGTRIGLVALELPADGPDQGSSEQE